MTEQDVIAALEAGELTAKKIGSSLPHQALSPGGIPGEIKCPVIGAGRLGLAFFLCFFFLFSSGRIASQDAGQQLQVLVLLATSGGLSQDTGEAGPADASWVRAPNGRFYQAHDIGNVVLLLPAASIGARLSQRPTLTTS